MRATKVLFVLLWFLCVYAPSSFCANVTYDHRALVIDGKRRVLVSGSIHYPRSTPEMWPDLIQKSKDGGLDVIETYVFWNLHEPVRGQYNFEGRGDLVRFVKVVAAAGLYVHLRIGPYACAEWNYGGFPLWLHFIPGIKFRTDNKPFEEEMKRFTAKIVDMMKQENLYASQGGPIILSQVENEYGNIDAAYGPAAKSYINWAASMATSLDTGVPWVMCQQADAPDPIINTCNGFYCDQFTPNSNAKPKIWTEGYTGWFLSFGDAVPHRPVEDLAFAVARFYQRGGTFQNYYMYHGGTNFGRASGGPFVSSSYDYDAPIDEYGIIRQPKWGHLKDVHKAIKLCEEALVATDPTITSLGPNIEAAVYKTGAICAAFLANIATSDATVTFNGNSYHLPAWSVSILPDCKKVVLNTAKINSASMISSFTTESLKEEVGSLDEYSSSGWSWISEPIGISKADSFSKFGLLEQINTTADRSDYLWYSLSIDLDAGAQPVLHIKSLGHALHAFINGKLAGSATGNHEKANFNVDIPITLVAGKNKIDLLSLTVGLQNYGAFFDTWGAGITGPVILKGLKNGSTLDLSSRQWTYQVGLKGEDLGLPSGSSGQWNSQSTLPTNQPLIWYKTNFVAPSGSNPVAIDFTGMGKGEAWVNGQSIGRYWPTYVSPTGGCTDSCNYRGAYDASKCLKNCGKPSQTFYHVPRSWLRSDSNTLVLFEESGGKPTQISFATKQIGSVCSHVSESHPPPVDLWNSETESRRKVEPLLSLDCPYPNQVISSINFASFGTPHGTCGNFKHGRCSSNKALSIVQKFRSVISITYQIIVCFKVSSKPSFNKTKMMKKQYVLSFSLALLLSFLYSTTTLAQLSPVAAPLKPPQPIPTPTPPAAAPKPLVPSLPESPSDATPDTAAVDIVGILRQAKSFNILIRLMKTTQLINQLNAQLLTTKSGGITILAPDDSSFSELKAGFLNSLSDGQKLELLQFHVLSDYVSSSNFDTLTNPVRTLAGAKPGKVELNVISYGGSVNISTGEVNTTITGIVYTDKHLAIYKVGKVLLPMDFFAVAKAPAKAPSLAPEPSSDAAKAPKADKDESSSSDSSQVNPTEQNSGTQKISVYGMWVSLVLGVLVMSAMTV
ncbi:Beta-galactosidase 8 [Mucuna pruriens]|uniref:Beta-galactosidase n=1 Tax=Mucuna pruriens TaxID=157652 RepID=A0A371I3G4_MUCPR|nr:Beta-galactosidase 8 [Mucuna pruriens]